MSDEPFMEHPTGEHATAVDAMEAAITRLRALPVWDRPITFCAQGEGSSPDAVHFAEVRIASNILETETPLNLTDVRTRARVAERAITQADGGHYSIAGATPREAAQILDAVFRHHMGIRPFADEGNDYAVGAEW